MERLFARKQVDLGLEEVDFAGITDPESRTAFFRKLIGSLPDFTLNSAMRVNAIAPTRSRGGRPRRRRRGGGSGRGGQRADARNRQGAVFQGQSLLTSPQYHAMHDQGFFITGITWSAKRNVSLYQIAEFEAGFKEAAPGRGSDTTSAAGTPNEVAKLRSASNRCRLRIRRSSEM